MRANRVLASIKAVPSQVSLPASSKAHHGLHRGIHHARRWCLGQSDTPCVRRRSSHADRSAAWGGRSAVQTRFPYRRASCCSAPGSTLVARARQAHTGVQGATGGSIRACCPSEISCPFPRIAFPATDSYAFRRSLRCRSALLSADPIRHPNLFSKTPPLSPYSMLPALKPPTLRLELESRNARHRILSILSHAPPNSKFVPPRRPRWVPWRFDSPTLPLRALRQA